MSFSFVSGDKDTFLFDREELERFGSVENVRQGLTCFSESRVISIDSDDKRLWASVEDEKGDNLPLTVQIEKGPENTLIASCDCTTADNSACLHIVAVLFAYADLCQENDGLMSAVDFAVKDRIKRAKAEVRVEAESGQPWFGSWQASSVNALFPAPTG